MAEELWFFKNLQKQMNLLNEMSKESMAFITSQLPVFGDSWLKGIYTNPLDPQRLQAMAEAGKFLQDCREVAGINLKELTESLNISDDTLLENVEQGKKSLSLEMIFRLASLLARHDPLPFTIKFLRTYSPAVDKSLELWGQDIIPKAIERERRFVNLYRQNDNLRSLSDEEYDRFIHYISSATDLVLDIMQSEREVKSTS